METFGLFAANDARHFSFPTDPTGRAIVADVEGFLRNVLTLSSFIVSST